MRSSSGTAAPRSIRPIRSRITRAIFGNSLTLRWLLNSAIVALGQTAGVLILASLAGYGFRPAGISR